MNRKSIQKFLSKQSTVWTISLCMTGALVLGGVVAVNNIRRGMELETESDQIAYLEEEIPEDGSTDLFPTLEEETEDLAFVSGNRVDAQIEENVIAPKTDTEKSVMEKDSPETEPEMADQIAPEEVEEDSPAEEMAYDQSQEAASMDVISEQALLDAGVSFSEENSLVWPSAGTILIDYSMDGTVYFPTLNQYKYNPALIIGSETGNQVIAAAKGIVESVFIDEETGTTLVLNLGNGYKLTYGELKELTVDSGETVEAGELLGYVSEPTKYYNEEGSNLYFEMTKDGNPVDPIMYLE